MRIIILFLALVVSSTALANPVPIMRFPTGTPVYITCDNNCILCNYSGNVLKISFNSSCSSGPSGSLTFLSIPLTFNGSLLTFKGD